MNRKKLLGKRIRELRQRKKITQEKLSELISVDPATISNIENGKNYPSMTNLEAILKVLGSNFLEAFDFDHKMPVENLLNEIVLTLNNNPDKIEDVYKIVIALTK